MRTRSSRLGVLASVAASIFSTSSLVASPQNTIVVTTAAELAAALVPANEGARIHVTAGDYDVSAPLVLPNRATLEGEGVMTFDASGLPAGFEPAGRTSIRATLDLVGDILTLGDRTTVHGLAIEDADGRVGFLAGNPVAVLSRAAGDSVSARIEACEIINPNPSGIAPSGPTGRGLVVVTRNPNLAQDPPPHEGSALSVKMTDSIVRSPGAGFGIFVINFASASSIQLGLKNSVIGGGLSANGGVGRPNAVSGSSVSIQSDDNLYVSDSSDQASTGLGLLGGADAPSPAFISEPSTFNSLRIHSQGDRIEGFAIGIVAAGGRRFGPLAGTISSNTVDLNLHGTHVESTDTDLSLLGALSFVDVATGDQNILRVLIRQAQGSGPRANEYANSTTPSMTDLGSGNRLVIVGSSTAFDRTNDDIAPPPPAEFFESGN